IDDFAYSMPPLDAPVARDPWLRARFVDPYTWKSWYPIRFDGENVFWGLVDGPGRDFDYFGLSQLERPSSDLSLPDIERDFCFRPCRLSELKPWRPNPDPDCERGTVQIELAGRCCPDGEDIHLIELGARGNAGSVRIPLEAMDDFVARLIEVL